MSFAPEALDELARVFADLAFEELLREIEEAESKEPVAPSLPAPSIQMSAPIQSTNIDCSLAALAALQEAKP